MVFASILGWSGVGFITRCYQLGLQKRNPFENFGGHALYMTVGAAAGYYFHGLQERQVELIQKKKEEIQRNRERLAAKNAE